MQTYQTKARKFSGTDFREVNQKAAGLYSEIKRKSKRRTYIRSAYFNKEKIFNEIFYVHIKEDKRTGQKFFISVFPEK